LSLAEKLAEACREDRREIYNKLKRAAERAIRLARGLERWLLHGSTSLYAGGLHTLGKPRVHSHETPLLDTRQPRPT
jgi:hypothetical protein